MDDRHLAPIDRHRFGQKAQVIEVDEISGVEVVRRAMTLPQQLQSAHRQEQ